MPVTQVASHEASAMLDVRGSWNPRFSLGDSAAARFQSELLVLAARKGRVSLKRTAEDWAAKRGPSTSGLRRLPLTPPRRLAPTTLGRQGRQLLWELAKCARELPIVRGRLLNLSAPNWIPILLHSLVIYNKPIDENNNSNTNNCVRVYYIM